MIGDIGMPGLPGLPGLRGPIGLRGDDGLEGLVGLPGPKGSFFFHPSRLIACSSLCFPSSELGKFNPRDTLAYLSFQLSP